MFTDISTGDYPKTLLICNNPGGMIWQVYHVRNNQEATTLAENAHNNGFYGITLEDYQPDVYGETWPGWRMNADPAIIGENYKPTEEDIAEYNERMEREQQEWQDMFPSEENL